MNLPETELMLMEQIPQFFYTSHILYFNFFLTWKQSYHSVSILSSIESTQD